MMKIDRKDLGAGLSFIAIGALYGGIAMWGGLGNPQLPMGRALSMGPGYFPVVLSCILIIIGAVLAGRSFFAERATEFFGTISWRAIFMLSLAVIFFGTYVREMGLALAVFAVTFLSALASRWVTPLYAAMTGVGMAILCTAVFGYGIKLPIPVIGTWFVN